MSVDLSKYVGQEVEITYVTGITEVCKVTYNKNHTTLPYLVGGDHYTKDGYHWYSRIPSDRNIIKVTPIQSMKKYEQLAQEPTDTLLASPTIRR